jgi:hypothetical protein
MLSVPFLFAFPPPYRRERDWHCFVPPMEWRGRGVLYLDLPPCLAARAFPPAPQGGYYQIQSGRQLFLQSS